MVRNVLSVVLGYTIFVISSLTLFKFSGIDPHADPSMVIIIITMLYGALFSFLSGYVTKRISQSNSLNMNFILSIVMAGFALFSSFKSEGNHWTQILAIAVFAPLTILGGMSKHNWKTIFKKK